MENVNSNDTIDIHSRLTALETKWDTVIPPLTRDVKTIKDGMDILIAEHNQRKGARKLFGVLLAAAGAWGGWKIHGPH